MVVVVPSAVVLATAAIIVASAVVLATAVVAVASAVVLATAAVVASARFVPPVANAVFEAGIADTVVDVAKITFAPAYSDVVASYALVLFITIEYSDFEDAVLSLACIKDPIAETKKLCYE